ncbi:unnamed protein product [Arctogadus glacialis]
MLALRYGVIIPAWVCVPVMHVCVCVLMCVCVCVRAFVVYVHVFVCVCVCVCVCCCATDCESNRDLSSCSLLELSQDPSPTLTGRDRTM